MFYVDTSVLAAYYCPEPLSQKAERFLMRNQLLSVSMLTEVELASAVGRKVRDGDLPAADGARIMACFLSHQEGGFYSLLPVGPEHYRLARDWIAQFTVPLRSLDALHLATASVARATVVTADKGLSKAAKALGVETVLLRA